MSEKVYKAALIIIGDEILSGRTQDANLNYLAKWLGMRGVNLAEVRVVSDDKPAIIAAVNAVRPLYDYIFTTGGIGPTHDDITADCIAEAFGVPLEIHPEAYRRMAEYYHSGVEAREFTKERQRMTRVPQGGTLIDNSLSIAPGFQIGNVFVMAGVPAIMQSMLDNLGDDRVKGGARTMSQTIAFDLPESVLAGPLGIIQHAHPSTQIGSYPQYRDGKAGVEIVVRAVDQTALDAAVEAVKALG